MTTRKVFLAPIPIVELEDTYWLGSSESSGVQCGSLSESSGAGNRSEGRHDFMDTVKRTKQKGGKNGFIYIIFQRACYSERPPVIYSKVTRKPVAKTLIFWGARYIDQSHSGKVLQCENMTSDPYGQKIRLKKFHRSCRRHKMWVKRNHENILGANMPHIRQVLANA